ncbi:MAG: phosphotransferase [Gammaproteobacteria bacterium]|nr:phosphotransferase [Gammaproteobacteria bacterium]MCY4228344.1 phosphotransferase [Gammaproteobacteria bacterium]
MDEAKLLAVSQFLANSGYAGCKITSLVPDASFRQYHRLERDGQKAMLLDAPPDKENLRDFISISTHLQKLGIRCPKIYDHDMALGFALIEDLGDLTFTRLLNERADETALYTQAIHVLANLHNNPTACDIKLPYYDWRHFIDEALLFVDWYLPLAAGERMPETDRDAFIEEWFEIHDRLSPLEDSLVLRDYHVDNLMQVGNDCAVLDYQDALIGSCSYDFISLLEDARRDISRELFDSMIELYWSLRDEQVDRKNFRQHCSIFGAARHMKIAGIFTRLWVRDNKPVYLKHLPRVIGYISRSLHDPKLKRIQKWLSSLGVELRTISPALSREQLLEICQSP